MIRGYCSAVRSAMTDDGRPPLEASGLKLHDRLSAIAGSLGRARGEGGLPAGADAAGGRSIRGALAAAGGAFAPLYLAFGWVHRAAHILGQVELRRGRRAEPVGRAARGDAAAPGVGRRAGRGGGPLREGEPELLAGAVRAATTRPELPRTNNDLEQAFGSHRYHERRATGRKGASPALVLRGSARLVAGLATRQREVTAARPGRGGPGRVAAAAGRVGGAAASGGSNAGGSAATPTAT